MPSHLFDEARVSSSGVLCALVILLSLSRVFNVNYAFSFNRIAETINPEYSLASSFQEAGRGLHPEDQTNRI